MKHIDLFKNFLRDTVNLNDTRIIGLEDSITAIKNVVNGSIWDPKIRKWMAQGSWAHKTIIKPVDNGQFDADLLVFIDPVDGWTAKSYIDSLYDVFRSNGTYRDKVRRYSHCVTISYVNEKKIDVAPCVVNRIGTSLEVCNRNSDTFEFSEPEKYTNWLIEINGYTGNNSFRKVTRLVKYLRDIKTRFTCSSVLLTTLLADRITENDKESPDFADTPTALKTVFGRLDAWLQKNETKPSIINPFLVTEDFASAWTDDQYANFREKINKYRSWVDDAFDEVNKAESIAKWRRVFGDDFAKEVVLEEGTTVSKSVLENVRKVHSNFTGDVVDAVVKFGAKYVPATFDKLSYMEAPRWRRDTATDITVSIRAQLHAIQKDGCPLRVVQDFQRLNTGYWLHFTALNGIGSPFDVRSFDVKWRVTNTGEVAARNKALRGKFEDAEKDNNTRWEQLSYRGLHLVEAFIIRKRDEKIIGQSAPFHVLIE